jgi:GT2 family glycosyltransferase
MSRGVARSLISVVVVSRNEGAWLAHTVENLHDTLPGDTEIVVVDDGSDDGSADFLGQMRTGPRLMRTPGVGVARARNFGALHTRGAVILFVDAHMEFSRDWWHTLSDVLGLPNAGLAASAVAPTNDRKTFGYGFTLKSPDLSLAWLKRLDRAPFQALILPGACLAMRRDAFERTGGFDEGLRSRGGVDAEMGVRFWLLGYESWVVPESKVWHLFRHSAPFPVRRKDVIHNRLRLASVHFNRRRAGTVREALAGDPAFEDARWLLAKSGFSARRSQLRATRLHDDNWLFEKFAILW